MIRQVARHAHAGSVPPAAMVRLFDDSPFGDFLQVIAFKRSDILKKLRQRLSLNQSFNSLFINKFIS